MPDFFSSKFQGTYLSRTLILVFTFKNSMAYHEMKVGNGTTSFESQSARCRWINVILNFSMKRTWGHSFVTNLMIKSRLRQICEWFYSTCSQYNNSISSEHGKKYIAEQKSSKVGNMNMHSFMGVVCVWHFDTSLQTEEYAPM